MMRPTATLLLIAALAATSHAADEPKGDLAKLQGSWTGKIGPERNIPITMTLKGNAVELKGTTPNGDEFKITGELKLDEKAKPKTIDYLKFALPDGNELPDSLGLYKIEGDSFIVCSGGPGGDRPTEFKAGEEGPPMLTTWTRVKDKEKPADPEKPKVAELDKFQGVWLAKTGPDQSWTVEMEIKGANVSSRWPTSADTDVLLKGEIKLDDKKEPRRIDFVNFKSADGGELRDNLGIYTFDGDAMKLCIGGPAGERPADFKPGEGQWPTVLLFKKK